MEEKYSLELNILELQIVLKGLEELPLKQSKPVYDNLVNQYQALQIAKEEKAKAAKNEVKSKK